MEGRLSILSISSRILGLLHRLVLLFLQSKFQYSLLVVSSLSAKLLHLYTHRTSLPILLSLLYAPTFFLSDIILIIGSQLLLFRDDKVGPAPVRVLATLLTYLTAVASTCQISFYLETGGEIQWSAAASLASGPSGFAMLLTGLPTFAVASTMIVIVAWSITTIMFDIVSGLVAIVVSDFKTCYTALKSRHRTFTDPEGSDMLLEAYSSEKQDVPSMRRPIMSASAVIMAITTCITLQAVRPTTPPYAHMSGTVPFSIIESFLFSPTNADFCLPDPQQIVHFPFDVMSTGATRNSAENFAKWVSQFDQCQHLKHDPFELSHQRNPHAHENHAFYNPGCDPLKISNLDNEIIASLQETFADGQVPIKHVVMLTLESTRKDVFPFMRGSQLHKKLVVSYKEDDDIDALNGRLNDLTPVAGVLSGERTGFRKSFDRGGRKLPKSSWVDRFNSSFGGMNVQGVRSTSDYTFKSLLGSHCGVEGLAADFTEEVNGQIYQPCIPQILDKMNAELPDTPALHSSNGKPLAESNILSWPWMSVLVQSITEQFDSQDALDEQMGFRHVVTKETMRNQSAKYYPPHEPENNYFGFPETETQPYLRDLFKDAERDHRRLFLSHITSTTHHPFKTPKSWGPHEEYLAQSRWRSEDPLNSYLNTIKYQDEWIGTIFELLEEVGVLEETLVVIVGDHGTAFDSVDGSSHTYQNSHISNFQVPLLFLHPRMPRIQIKAKTTNLSILPTVLDLLAHTGSLSFRNTKTVQQLIPQYQGQSLIHGFVPLTDDGRQPWYFSLINPGGSMMVISSAATSFRLLMPLCSSTKFKFTDINKDPAEMRGAEGWTMDQLVAKVQREEGEEAAQWVAQAERLGKWWFWEQKRRWNYHKEARSTDRIGTDQGGKLKKDHWWET